MARGKSKKTIIVSAALKVFSEKSFSKTSIQDIAEEAKIGKGTVYEYFQSKDELFIEGYKFAMSNLVERVDLIVNTPLKFWDKVDAFIRLIQDVSLETGKKMKLLAQDSVGDLKPESRQRLEKILFEMRQQIFDKFSIIIEQGHKEGLLRNLEGSFIAKTLVGLTFVMCMVNQPWAENAVLAEDMTKHMENERLMLLDLIQCGISKANY